jgi:hypothetical protein
MAEYDRLMRQGIDPYAPNTQVNYSDAMRSNVQMAGTVGKVTGIPSTPLTQSAAYITTAGYAFQPLQAGAVNSLGAIINAPGNAVASVVDAAGKVVGFITDAAGQGASNFKQAYNLQGGSATQPTVAPIATSTPVLQPVVVPVSTVQSVARPPIGATYANPYASQKTVLPTTQTGVGSTPSNSLVSPASTSLRDQTAAKLLARKMKYNRVGKKAKATRRKPKTSKRKASISKTQNSMVNGWMRKKVKF